VHAGLDGLLALQQIPYPLADLLLGRVDSSAHRLLLMQPSALAVEVLVGRPWRGKVDTQHALCECLD
jgi:hypothetical protein